MKDTLPERVRLGAFEVDLRAGELWDGERVVRLQAQPLQILAMLIARGGDIVTRDEIRRTLWPNDTVVEFDHSINAAIKKLRQALGDTADEPKYVETVARRGYRLLTPVEAVAAEASSGDRGFAAELATAVTNAAGLIGKNVSHYRVLKVIGGGGMGLVYEAEDLKLGRRVALKFLPDELLWDAVALQRFEREAQTASSLNHPHICTIYEIDEHEDQPFIAMELLEGQTLRDLLGELAASTRKLPLAELLDIGVQICAALQAAHEKGIIHRDIKPANIFLSGAGQVKILDFGLAKLVSKGKEVSSDGLRLEATGDTAAAPLPARSLPSDATLTRFGTALGTAGYMSPEQVRGEKLDARTDIFSLGLVLYEMATGRRAFTGETAAIIQNAIVNHAPPPARESNPEIPASLERVIHKALEKDREQRYRSAVDVGNELQRIKHELDSRHARSGRRWMVWSAAAAVLLLLATGFVAARFSRRPAGPAPELKDRQITANPSEDPVIGAAISPDGKYLAYQDQTGLYLRSIDSGETRLINVPAEVHNRIFFLCWSPEGDGLLANVEGENGGFDIWTIPIVTASQPQLLPTSAGAAARPLYRHAAAGGISPDGRMIAFTTGQFGRQWKELWVGGSDGVARKLATMGDGEQLFSPVWSPDGNWIAYGEIRTTPQGAMTSTIEVRPAAGGPAKTIVTDASLAAPGKLSLAISLWVMGGWSGDWRLLFTVAQSPESPSGRARYSLWGVRVDPRAGNAYDKPRQVSAWSEALPRNVTFTSDGKRLTMLRERYWLNVYLGELALNGTGMKPPQRFTLDDRGSSVSGWTRDSQAVIFDSPRNGKREIFSQSVNENVVERMVLGSGDVYGAVMSPDGTWLLYWESSAAEASNGKARLMRQPTAGGPAQILLEAPVQEHRHRFSCSSNPRAMVPCVMSLDEARDLDKGRNLVFYSVDPLQGKGKRLGEIEVFGAFEDWDLSPDGSSVALVDADKYDGRIEVLNLVTGNWHEIRVGPGGEHLQSIAWASDGKSFFATPYSAYMYNVLHITLAGNVQPLLNNGRPQWMVAPLPSPNGKYLAFDGQTWDSNVWMINDF